MCCKKINNVPVKLGQKVWIIFDTCLYRVSVYVIGKGIFVVEYDDGLGHRWFQVHHINDIGCTWFTRLADAKKALKEKYVIPKCDKVTFVKVNKNCYTIRTTTKL